jgi:muramoyltetrapeptide carboxypeptidase
LGYLAGKDENRAQDFMDMFLDDSVDMILCIRGGYGSSRILPYINFEVIKANPKIFGGFSDITVLLNLLSEKCKLTTFHSPMGSSKLDDEETFNSLMMSVMNGGSPYSISNPIGFPATSIKKGISEGVLVGGNLSLLCSLLGTCYEIDLTDKILFLEDVGVEPYQVDRMLTQLLLGNKLQSCKGLILGQFTDCQLNNYEKSLTLDEVFQDRLYSINTPILKDFCSGHSYPKLTLPIGAKIRLDTYEGIIDVIESVVK